MRVFSLESVIEEFEALTNDAGRLQTESLRKILEQNGEAEYLRNLGLGGRTDPESFRACIPLVTHRDLEPYIQRIADGDTSVLTGKPITSISLRWSFSTHSSFSCGLPRFWSCSILRSLILLFLPQFWYHTRQTQVFTIQ